MVTSLSDRVDVLYFRPEVPKGYFRAGYEKQAVLLPMKACKVLVPYPKDDVLNLFQKTILKLLHSGVKDEKWLAEKLSLDLSLVELVVKELKERKLITQAREITEEGKKILEEESLSYEMKTGYIFYDHVSQSYMDAFVPDSRFSPCEIRKRIKDAGIIQFFMDNSDPNSAYESAVVVKTDESATAVRPTVYDVLKVCRRQRSRERMLFAGNRAESRDEEVTRFAHSDKVSLLGEFKDVYVVSYLVIPTGDIVNKSRMQVLYPFGEGFSPQMMEPIKKCAGYPENASLGKAIEELKKQQTSLTDQERRHARTADERTVRRIDAILSENIARYPYVNKRALEVESKREDIVRLRDEEKGNQGKNWETINSSINDYIIAIYRLLAAALIDVSDRNEYYKDLLNQDMKHNSATLSEIALRCGFTDEGIFAGYFLIKKGRVIGAYGSEGAKASEEVCALISLNLLEAYSNAEHPFYKLARVVPSFIADAYKLTCLRNDGMHGNDIEYNFRHVEGLGKKFFRIISILLDGLSFHEEQFAIDASAAMDENAIRHRKEAEYQAESLFTRGMNRYAGLADKLVDLIEEQNYGEEYLEDFKSDGKDSERDKKAVKTVRTGESYPTYAAEVIELILKELCRHRLHKKALKGLKPYSDEYGKEILNRMREQGFRLTEIPYYSLPNISKSFHNYEMGTMQTNFYVWYFSELEQPDSMIPEAAEAAPNLIQVIRDAIEAREHKGWMDYGDERLDFMKKELANCINQLIDLMIRRGLY